MIKNSILRIINIIGVFLLLVSPLAPISPFLPKASAAYPPQPATVFTVLAAGEGDKVRTETSNNQTTNSNGTEWYHTTESYKSMGFAPGGATINQDSADTNDPNPGDPTGDLRLSWHTSPGNLMSGYRAGTNKDLGDGWYRYIYEADTLPSYYPSGPQTNVPETSVTGWTMCFQGSYGDNNVPLTIINNECDGSYLMYAAANVEGQKIDIKQNGESLLEEIGGDFSEVNKVYPGSTVNLSLYEKDGVTPINWNTYKAFVSNCNYDDCNSDSPLNDTDPTSWDAGTITSATYTIPAGSELKQIVFFAADDETGDVVSDFVKINISKIPDTHMISDCEQLFSMDTDFGQGSVVDTYKLSNDIDCSSVENPDPLSWDYGSFAGIFDGQGHTIRNLTMNSEGNDYYGIFGQLESATIKNVTIEDSTVTGLYFVGSIVGYADSATFENVHSTADVSGGGYVGGLIGYAYQITVSDSSATGNVTADKNISNSIGGFAGSIEGESTITRSFATGNVEGRYSVGGFAGGIYSSTISYSAATGNVSSDTVVNGDGTGGFAGRIAENSHVYESLATGHVEGYTRVGGFAGANGGLIENAYARGDVTGNNNVGGFAGRCGGDITNAYSTGFIDGGSATGGFLGSNQGCDVVNSYWDIEQSDTVVSAAGTGKTTAEMIQQTTFEDWDFNEVWVIDPGTNDSYPSFLKFGEDNDLDGVSSSIEETGPNSGDSNNDGLADKYQENVTSLPNVNSSNYIVLETSCGTGTKNKDVSVSSEDESKKDAAYSYTQGLVSFKTQCQDVGGTASVSLYFYGVSTKDGLALRKFNPVTSAYTLISDPTLTLLTIDGQSVLKATYSITDGGPLDQDGVADGTITDPVGLASLTVSVPNTGL